MIGIYDVQAERGEFILNGTLRLFGRRILQTQRTERLSVLLLSRVEYSRIMRLKNGKWSYSKILCSAFSPPCTGSFPTCSARANIMHSFGLPCPKSPWDGLFNGCLYKVVMAPSLFPTQPAAEPGQDLV